ncbi:hypothetical protein K435DRAFT_845522 [Dendrothele bispora CBS 962.96]|uniref:Uncharacterized protein n=1 Tax=Dendrothele bispora (strain CBS 962.96) TaxID=1314807 RepID=A0A4S8KTU6_DENBC|nr:hypothetical protein K435DRAFT_845522 [Dendrothele bispora CBS 962.96]
MVRLALATNHPFPLHTGVRTAQLAAASSLATYIIDFYLLRNNIVKIPSFTSKTIKEAGDPNAFVCNRFRVNKNMIDRLTSVKKHEPGEPSNSLAIDFDDEEEEEEESIKPGKVQELNTGVREAPRCAARYIIVPGTQLNHMNELKALCPT